MTVASSTATAPTAPHRPRFRQLVGLVREDWQANLREFRYPGFQALFAYRVGCLHHRLRSRRGRALISTLARRLQGRVVARYGIELHDTAHIGRRVRIIHQSAIVVGERAVIGDDCWIRQGVHIGGENGAVERGPILGRDVRLGVGVVIADGIIVGDGARLGPNTVVTSDVPEGAAVMPARSRILEL